MRRGQLGASPEVIQTRHPNTVSTSNGIDFFSVDSAKYWKILQWFVWVFVATRWNNSNLINQWLNFIQSTAYFQLRWEKCFCYIGLAEGLEQWFQHLPLLSSPRLINTGLTLQPSVQVPSHRMPKRMEEFSSILFCFPLCCVTAVKFWIW